ncbi:hypothetical protein FMUAM8_02630 [Nocardia cyriacigeorgica]|nr:hypothetical protein FMUAM8_02630 [Nocardia cyriacigeorgica]
MGVCVGVPFVGSVAVRDGRVSKWQLERRFARVYPDVYVLPGDSLDGRGKAIAAGLWAKGSGILVGVSAAALHGARWLDDRQPEIAFPDKARAPSGLKVYKMRIPDDEVCRVEGLRCTTSVRTAYDLARRLDFDDAVAVLDALCHKTGLDPGQVKALSLRHPRARGNARVSRILDYVDPGAESIPETRTRLLLVRAGLPAPETQIPIYRDGRLFARLDMGWRTHKVAVEYDGAHHWTTATQRAWDIDRQATLESQGWTLIRVSSRQLTRTPHTIITRTREALTRGT